MVVGFHAVEPAAGMGIEVDTDENGVAVAVGNGRPVTQGNEFVTGPSQGDGHALGLEHGLDFAGDFQGKVFLIDAASVCALVFAAVSGIDDDPGDFPGLGLPAARQKEGEKNTQPAVRPVMTTP